ncbi:nuclear transport factor 2 family protein [Promicromonospora sp. Populi]|uniref:nuclear transport factor 2 family protein n=1 Tax=Promicromonospora sp. Populi TaxID=3239420 RepID=UPI0034E21B93
MSAETSLSEQSRAVVLGMFEAANRGDVDGVFSFLSDDEFACIEPSFMPFGGTWSGKDGFLELAGHLPNYLDSSEITVHYTLADGERVAAVVGIKDVATGELLHFLEHFTVKDGKIVENRVFYNDAGTLADQPKIA